jgi:hypothetical protein
MIEQQTEEIWKSLKFMELSRYFVSNIGNLRNDELTTKFGNSVVGGYIQNLLRLDCNKQKNLKRHGLVAFAFLEKPENNSFTVDHIDRNKLNNCVENLRWCSRSEQNKNKDKIISGKRKKYSGVTLKQKT